jgi:hypothetical protein
MIQLRAILISAKEPLIMTDVLANAELDLKSKIAEHVAALQAQESWLEIRRIHAALNALEGIRKVPKTDLVTLLGIGSGEDRPKIGSYDFVADSPLDAAKKYLRMIAPKQKAASLDEILAALKSGGLNPDRDELRISLSRSTTEIYKVGDDVYGLLENFPNVRRGMPGRKKSTANGSQSGGTGQTFETPVSDSEISKEEQP